MLPISFDSGNGSVWVQKSGPNTSAELLECGADVADIGNPRGGFTRTWEISPSTGKWQQVHIAQDAPDSISTTITTRLLSTRSVMEQIVCPGGLYIFEHNCKKGNWGDYLRIILGENMRITDDVISNLSMREAKDNTERAWEMELDARLMILPLRTMQLTTVVAEPASNIVFYNTLNCPPCGDGTDVCDQGFIVCDAAIAATANVMYTSDAGQTWANTATDPFLTVGEHIKGAGAYYKGNGVWRWVVGCGTTAAGAHARIAYSDNLGTTWTVVDLATTDAEFVPGAHSLCVYNDRNIWCGTDMGNTYFSEDGGLTWADKGPTTALDVMAVTFITPMIGWVGGDTNLLSKTADGGLTWQAVTGPAAEAATAVTVISMIDENRVWIGYNSGNAYYTNDAGVTWTARNIDAYAGAVVSHVGDIQFIDEYVGFMTVYYPTRIAALLRTYDGGFTWEKYATTVMDNTAPLFGLRSMAVCNENRVYAVGQLTTAVAAIYKFEA